MTNVFTNLAGQNTNIPGIITALVLILIIILIHFFKRRILKYAKKKIHISPKRLTKLEVPLVLIGIVISIDIIVSKIINTYTPLNLEITNLTNTLLILLVTYILMVISGIILERWNDTMSNGKKEKAHEEMLPLTKSVTNIILIIAAIFLVLDTWGVEIGGLLASVGVVGIILSFAFKDTLANIFGGIALSMDNSFSKGDLIELDDGEVGYIIEINLRSTRMKNFDDQEILVPNGRMANMTIKNYAHPTKTMRIKINVAVAYGSNITKFKKVVMKLLESQAVILKYPKPTIFFLEMGDYSLNFKIAFFVKNYNNLYKVRSDMTEKIYKELKKNKIKIPFPTRTLYMNQDN